MLLLLTDFLLEALDLEFEAPTDFILRDDHLLELLVY